MGSTTSTTLGSPESEHGYLAESVGHALRVSRSRFHLFAPPIPAHVEPKLAPHRTCSGESLKPCSHLSVIDPHYCGGQVMSDAIKANPGIPALAPYLR